MQKRIVDLIGKRFGRLVVLERLPVELTKSGNKVRKWKCVCDCGNVINAVHSNLTKGATQSCGCLQKELASKRFTTHKKRYTRLYSIHANMKQRCYNPKNNRYKNYGGRGITICHEWLGDNGFENFYNWAVQNGYKENLTIDRINNDGNYEPLNCRWANSKEQRLNTTNNHKLTYNGKTLTVYEWSKITGINYKCILSRINNYKWSVERTLTEKPLIGKNQYYRTNNLN